MYPLSPNNEPPCPLPRADELRSTKPKMQEMVVSTLHLSCYCPPSLSSSIPSSLFSCLVLPFSRVTSSLDLVVLHAFRGLEFETPPPPPPPPPSPLPNRFHSSLTLWQLLDGKLRSLLVHRKGSTRAFPPHHPLIPVDYQVSWAWQLPCTLGCCSSATSALKVTIIASAGG